MLANDTDVDGGPKTIAAVTQPANGTVAITGGGTGLTYAPDPNYCNSGGPTDAFTYTLNGGSTATVAVTVTCVDDAPIAVDDAATVAEDAGADRDRRARQRHRRRRRPEDDRRGHPARQRHRRDHRRRHRPHLHPDAELLQRRRPDRRLHLHPQRRLDRDRRGHRHLRRRRPGRRRRLRDRRRGLRRDAIDVLANDTDVDGGPKTIAAVTQPANGTVAITGGGTGLTYAPDRRTTAPAPTDDFTYTLNGGSTATVAVTVTCVDDPPIAVDDAATVAEDSGATAIDVLANDTDVDGGPKTITAVTQPANGTVAITGGGTGAHLHARTPNYCNGPAASTDDFTYTLNGGSTATVSVTVTCVDDAPTAVDDTATVAEDAGATAIDVLANDTDVDGGPHDDHRGHPARQRHGGDHRRRHRAHLHPERRTTATGPPASTDAFTYTLNGGSTATVSVTVTCVDDAPIAVDDAATVVEDAGANRDRRARQRHRRRRRPDTTITSVTQPANGTVVITGGGTGLTYTPNAELLQHGRRPTTSPTPSPRRLDRHRRGRSPSPASTTPRPRSTTPPPSPRTPAPTAIDVLANDTDVDGGPKTITAVTQPAHGTVVDHRRRHRAHLHPERRTTATDPPASTDNFTYTLNGGSTATVAVTVTCVDDAPIAVDDTATVAEDSGANAIDVLANDTDLDGGPKTITSVTQPDQRHGRDHRRRHRPHLHPDRELLQRRRPDRRLHLHPQRRLDRDRVGHRHLRRRSARSPSTTPPPSPRTPARTRSTCSPTTPTSTAARRRSPRSPSPPTARS